MVMPSHMIKRFVSGAAPIIHSTTSITDDQIQPASLDLRLGSAVYRVWAASLPRPDETVIDMISPIPDRCKYKFNLDKNTFNNLEKGHTYVVELMESCALPGHAWVEFSPKSSTGRCDVFARVLCDKYPHYDITPKGYHGPLWLEVTPLSFDMTVQEGLSLVQGRIKTEDTHMLTSRELAELQIEYGVLCDKQGKPLSQSDIRIHDNELYYHIDLDRTIVGFQAKSRANVALNLLAGNKKGVPLHNPRDFWIPIQRPSNGRLVLEPNVFYLLATKERTRIPPGVCGQVTSFKITTGEIRPHYAGFFDPGFGGVDGTNGVLEIRARDVPFDVSDSSPICSMKFERMLEVPEKLYGTGIESNYPKSRPSLSKHFEDRYDIWL